VRTVILGAGAAGLQLAKKLSEEKKDVALIERDPDIARVAANALDCLVVHGDGSLPEILERSGLSKAKNFVALTGSDEVNIVICSVVAAEYRETRRIARVRNPYFTKLEPARRTFMGVDRFVNPDIETARASRTRISYCGPPS
jgi:trk system potassium uptake protein TrkA